MRLIHTRSYRLLEFDDVSPPPFAVLSHAHSQEHRLQPPSVQLDNFILQACLQADVRGLEFLWVGSVCIDKTSSLELQHSISSSFRLLQAAAVCFVYLQDLPPSSDLLEGTWGRCRYWTRSWTLQELVAPSNVEFFDAAWNYQGAKSSPKLLELLQNITRIDRNILVNSTAFSKVAIGVRLSWAAGRESTHAEDTAYSLTGITGVNMSIRYGEGSELAFARLVKKIVQESTDGSIFAWTSNDDQVARGFLPRSATEFRHLTDNDTPRAFWPQQPWKFDGNIQFSSKGLIFDSRASTEDLSLILEIGRTSDKRFGVRIQMWENRYVRINPREIMEGSKISRPCRIIAACNIDAETSQSISISCRKRKRSGQLRTPPNEHSGVQLGITHTISHHLLHDNACSSCSYPEDASDLDSLHSGDEYEEEAPSQVDARERTSLESNHPYQTEREGLLRHFAVRVEDWARSAKYVAPTGSRLSRKRLKIADSSSYCASEESDFEEIEYIQNDIQITIDGYFHLACPFYATKPADHRQCLREDDLRTMEDVVDHIRKCHWKSPYCPNCRIIFKTPMARDEHIRKLICEIQDPTRIEGVDGNQLKGMVEVTMRGFSEAETWAQICALACPDVPTCVSPYLKDGLGLEVSKLRDYWNEKGREYIKKYMCERDVVLPEGQDEVRVLEAFHALTMADLIQKTVETSVHESQ
ncbi:HET domain-containing protein [Colletotrichum orchidophilum]|uniref:HET domain-containing protein n=1 Tax=Colletotrichum orchidophilum TaxID=1209926 RepID=A0A1G4ARL9_9PEZI|nr:HET domain-containing protein [Colletotrichum orchidophilum]OHE91751.1 HET domain-containing protein [Colletotrichum orchidophilum]